MKLARIAEVAAVATLLVGSRAPLWAAENATASTTGGMITGKVEATPAKFLDRTVVYLQSAPGAFTPKTWTIEQKGLQFAPGVLAISAGDTVNFPNHDQVLHNVYTPDNERFVLPPVPGGQTSTYTFKEAGKAYDLLCSFHPDMCAYVFVSQNPYSSVVDQNGAFQISNVPPGTYKVSVWNPKLKADAVDVTVPASGTANAAFALKR